MKPSEIEYWALKIIDQVIAKQPIEDSRVELKNKWIPAEQAARRLAGHANAARGDTILWLVGVDEENGVKGAEYKELAEWWSKVQSFFDGDAPFLTDVNVRHNNNTIVALFFETNRAPYVVKNPLFGKEKGEISREIPWREGTAVRTATRSDLIRLLVPIVHLPRVEILGGELDCYQAVDQISWSFVLNLYVEPPNAMAIVLPYHRCEASFEIPGLVSSTAFTGIRIVPPYKMQGSFTNWVPNSVTMDHTDFEVIIGGPGRIDVKGGIHTSAQATSFEDSTAKINVKLAPSYNEQTISLDTKIEWRSPEKGSSPNLISRWSSKGN